MFMSIYDRDRLGPISHTVTSIFGVESHVMTVVPATDCSLNSLLGSQPTTLAIIHDDNIISSSGRLTNTLTPAYMEAFADIINTNGLLRRTSIATVRVNVTGFTDDEKEHAYADIINITGAVLLLGSNSPLPFLSPTSSTEQLQATTPSGLFVEAAANIDMTTVHSVLSFANDIDGYALEDPALVPSSEWNPAHISLSATFADHVQALVAYLSLIHISEPTRLLSISYAVFCLKKKNHTITKTSMCINKSNTLSFVITIFIPS
eukprot:TRINITY_DN15572_c0_g1_i2.p2 TRINITY_DN15572_c0_g1~~TRINITY_DN15572_c0_g1_i2.p2  ORF type:complete len:263 (-),score=55.98 TRINITY_DN15572_c0_g1_i2:4-792(-)